jgi:hypothetical protein
MAKKKLQVKLELQASFKSMVPKNLEKVFNADLKRGEIALSYDIVHGDMTTSGDIFPDHFVRGSFEVSKIKEATIEIKVTGIVLKDLEPSFDNDLIKALEKSAELNVISRGLADSEMNDYFIDGDESTTLTIGKAILSK